MTDREIRQKRNAQRIAAPAKQSRSYQRRDEPRLDGEVRKACFLRKQKCAQNKNSKIARIETVTKAKSVDKVIEELKAREIKNQDSSLIKIESFLCDLEKKLSKEWENTLSKQKKTI